MSAEVFKQLLVSEKDLLHDAVAKAKDLISIEEETGRIILRIPKAHLGQKQVAALFLVGQYFAKQMGKSKSQSLSLEELAEWTGINPNTLSGRLSELADADWVRKLGKARFEINNFLLNHILDEIAASRRRPELVQPETPPEESSRLRQIEQGQIPPTLSRDKSLTEVILNLLRSDWGKKPRDWTEIKQVLKDNALNYSKGSVTGTLTLMTQAGRVRRIKDGRSYRYQAS